MRIFMEVSHLRRLEKKRISMEKKFHISACCSCYMLRIHVVLRLFVDLHEQEEGLCNAPINRYTLQTFY